MKLLEFKCIKSNDEEELGNVEYFIQLEGDEERDAYKWTHDRMNDERLAPESQAYYAGYWDCYMTEKLDNDMSEGEVWYYFMDKEEVVPEVGGTFSLDDTVWERIA